MEKPGFAITLACLCLYLLVSSCSSQDAESAEEALPGRRPAAAEGLEAMDLHQVEEADFQGNVLQYTIVNPTGERHGRFLKLDQHGNVLEEAYYLYGKLDGQRILFYPNQDTLIIESHANGAFQGPYQAYYPGNHLKLEGHYLDNQMQGTWYVYYDTGELKEEVTFVDNQENGPFIEYHKNGQISVTGQYLNGDNEDGTLQFFDETGVHYKTMECNEGLCRTTWKREDEVQ